MPARHLLFSTGAASPKVSPCLARLLAACRRLFAVVVRSPSPISEPRKLDSPTNWDFDFRSTADYMAFNRRVICVTAVVTIQLLSWCMRCSRKKNRFLPAWFQRDVELRDETCSQAGSYSDWGNLLPELRTEIGIRLSNRPDVLRFRSLCKTWRSSLPLPARFPMQVPPPPGSDPEFAYFITEVILTSYWLRGVSFEEVDQSGKCCTDYMYPIRSKLNPIDAKECVASLMDRISEGLSVLSKAYYIRMASPRKLEHGGQWNLEYNKYVQKIVMISSSSSNGVNPCYARVTDLSVVAHLSWGPMNGRLALLRLQGSSSSYDQWKWETDFCTKVFYDISTYRGRLCTIDPQGKLFLMDYESLKMTPLANLPPSMSSYLVGKELFEAGDGQLFWADKRSEDPMVIRLNVRTNEWVHPQKGEEYPLIPQLAYHAEPPSFLRDPSFWG